MSVTFITGNQGKADFLAKHVDYPIEHKKVDIDEIQSLELKEVAEYKARQAYDIVKSPVLVEDVGLTLEALGQLPGPLVKWFDLALGLEKTCWFVDRLGNRSATAMVCFVYFDGKSMKFFEGELAGSIADKPRGDNGFGFDPYFIPRGWDITLAEMTDEQLEQNSLRTTTVYPKIKKFLDTLDKN